MKLIGTISGLENTGFLLFSIHVENRLPIPNPNKISLQDNFNQNIGILVINKLSNYFIEQE